MKFLSLFRDGEHVFLESLKISWKCLKKFRFFLLHLIRFVNNVIIKSREPTQRNLKWKSNRVWLWSMLIPERTVYSVILWQKEIFDWKWIIFPDKTTHLYILNLLLQSTRQFRRTVLTKNFSIRGIKVSTSLKIQNWPGKNKSKQMRKSQIDPLSKVYFKHLNSTHSRKI